MTIITTFHRMVVVATFVAFEIVACEMNNESMNIVGDITYRDIETLKNFVEDYSEFRVQKRLEVFAEFSLSDRRWLQLLRQHSSLVSMKRLLPGLALGELALELVRKAGHLPPLMVLVFPSSRLLLQLETLERPIFKRLPMLVLLRRSTLPQLSLPVDNLVTFAMASHSDDGFVESVTLAEQYTAAMGQPSATSTVGTWSQSTGVVASLHNENGWRRDLRGVTLRCVFVSQEVAGEVDTWHYHIIETLGHHLNFTCNYRESGDGEYGSQRDDGSWTGIVGELVSGKADIAISLDNTLARSQVIHFLLANELIGTVMVMKRTTYADTSWSRYTNEFSSGVWRTLMASALAMSLVHFWVTRTSPSERQRLTIAESLLEVIAAFGSQGSARVYNSTACRATQLVISASTLLVVAHYSSWLSAMLTVRTTSYPFDGFQSVLDDGTYVVGVVEGWSTKTEIQCSKDRLLQRVWTELVRDKGLVHTVAEGLQRALEERMIFLVHKEVFLLDQNFDKTQFTILPGVYFPRPAGYAVAKDSPYTETLNEGLLRLRMNGVQKKLLASQTKPNFGVSNMESVGAVTLEQTMPLFSLLSIACASSLFILVLEILAHRCIKEQSIVSEYKT